MSVKGSVMKNKKNSNFFKYEFWDLNLLFSLSYSNEFNLFHPSIQAAVRMSSVFDTIHVFEKINFDILGLKYLAAFGKSKHDLIAKDGIYLLQFNEPTLLSKYQAEIKKMASEGLPPNDNGVILKLKFIDSSLFKKIVPSDSFIRATKFIQYDFD